MDPFVLHSTVQKPKDFCKRAFLKISLTAVSKSIFQLNITDSATAVM